MSEREEDLDPVERCRKARDYLSQRYKTVKALGAYLRRLEKKYPANVAEGRRLLAQSEARRAEARLSAQQSSKPAVSRRSA